MPLQNKVWWGEGREGKEKRGGRGNDGGMVEKGEGELGISYSRKV